VIRKWKFVTGRQQEKRKKERGKKGAGKEKGIINTHVERKKEGEIVHKTSEKDWQRWNQRGRRSRKPRGVMCEGKYKI